MRRVTATISWTPWCGVVVGTFGDDLWRERGAETAEQTFEGHRVSVVHVHAETLARARNRGARELELLGGGAAVRSVCFLDADDELEPGYFQALRILREDLGNPAVRYVEPSGWRRAPEMLPEKDLSEGNYLIVGTTIPLDLFWRASGFREYPLYEDWDLFQRLWTQGATIGRSEEAVYVANVARGTRNRPGRAQEEFWTRAIRQRNFPSEQVP